MERLPLTGMTYDEYLALDDASEEPLEYVNGEIVAVGGASRRHNRVVGNVWGVLNQLLKGRPCVALAGSQRVYVAATNMGAHPDVVVLCGKAESDKDGRTLLNPSLIVEVLSPTTDDYDRGAKFRHYMRIPSFVEYLVVSPDELRVEHHRRIEAGQWLMREFTQADDTIEILKLGASMRRSLRPCRRSRLSVTCRGVARCRTRLPWLRSARERHSASACR